MIEYPASLSIRLLPQQITATPFRAELSVGHVKLRLDLIVSAYFDPFEQMTGYHLLLLQRRFVEFIRP